PADPILHVTQTAAPQELVFPEEEFRAHQPVAGAPRPFRLPPVKAFTLRSGVKVYLVEQHTLPLVSMDLNFDGGAVVDPKGKEGPASVAARVSGAVLYGAEHPFGAVVTEQSLAQLTLDDCKAFARAWLQPKQARLFVVGDLTEAKVRAYFDSPRLAGWTGA